MCSMLGECICQYVVEADGSVYPCDFYVLDEWNLGNIRDLSFREMTESDTAKRFVNVSRWKSPECRECKWYKICRGGCRRNREPFEDGRPVLNYFCPSFKEFFEYATPRLLEVKEILLKHRKSQL